MREGSDTAEESDIAEGIDLELPAVGNGKTIFENIDEVVLTVLDGARSAVLGGEAEAMRETGSVSVGEEGATWDAAEEFEAAVADLVLRWGPVVFDTVTLEVAVAAEREGPSSVGSMAETEAVETVFEGANEAVTGKEVALLADC